MQGITISNLVKKISEFFGNTFEELGLKTKFVQRDSKLTASGFIETLLISIQDSSGVELPSSLAPFFKGHGGGASDSSLKLQAMYDELNSSIDRLSITNGRRNDQSFTEHL